MSTPADTAVPEAEAGIVAEVSEAIGQVSLLPEERSQSLSTRAVHADDGIAAHRAVAPAMHVSTTFRYSDNPDHLETSANLDVSAC